MGNSEMGSYKEVKEMRTGLVFILTLTTTTVFAGKKYLIETGNSEPVHAETDTEYYEDTIHEHAIDIHACPVKRPKMFSHCYPPNARCSYGKECCCGKCDASIVFTCEDNTWIGMYTEFCMGGCGMLDHFRDVFSVDHLGKTARTPTVGTPAARANIDEDPSCPLKEPKSMSPCSTPNARCSYGTECCCGKCGNSTEFTCAEDTWIGMSTHFCMSPEC